ncbi:hypothetical protein [Microlunatus ginsengisoli]|uniref:hypothetical protein n=1 Tax=Microlunatus ginsengisoli TaxID=363863 RepID=UPI0031D9BDD8
MAGSFLPVYGPLPPSTLVVPSEVLDSSGTLDDRATASVLEISMTVDLTRQQVIEEDLSSALLEFRRRATQVAQLEDWYIFNGQYPRGGPQPAPSARLDRYLAQQSAIEREWTVDMPFRPDVAYSNSRWLSLSGVEPPATGVVPVRQKASLLARNPGALGLLEGAEVVTADDLADYDGNLSLAPRPVGGMSDRELTTTIVNAIATLDRNGYVAPHVCIFGRGPFVAVNTPLNSGAFPRDRIEPLIGREILHSSAIDIAPVGVGPETAQQWPLRGLLLSLAGGPIDIAMVVEATPEFRQVDARGHYIFAVVERFALRIKDRAAIVTMAFRN